MKCLSKILLIIMFMFIYSTFVYADITGTVNCTMPLRVRTSIDTSSDNNILTSLSYGDNVTILNTNAGSNSSCSVWMKVRVNKNGNSYTGYSCGEFISINGLRNTSSDNVYVKSDYDSYVDGDGTVACYEDTADWIYYQNPGGGATTGVHAKCGDVVKINEVKEYMSSSCRYWYNLTNKDGASGWLCGYYVSTNKLSSTANNYYANNGGLENYYNTLRAKNFPESYLPYLAEIHARHPNWSFEAEKINIDFGEAVAQESYSERSLLPKNAFDENYLSTNYGHYNPFTNTYFEASNEAGWYNASTEAIAFYMDPRNYLNEKYIFAFKNLRGSNEHNKELIHAILNPMGVWQSVYGNYSSSVEDDIVNVSSSLGIDSVHIASRIYQEMRGVKTSDPRLGASFTLNGTSYSGWYNFYNIAVTGNNKILNGMSYAINHGWNTPSKAIRGGIEFLKAYVDANQDTLYYERFDVSSSDGDYTHQYMANLQAPIGETNTAFSTYAKYLPSYLNSDISFIIPVYDNMPAYAVTSPKLGNPNNYLKELKINGNVISGFAYDVQEYDIVLPVNTNSVRLDATSLVSSSKISGTGDISLNSDVNKLTVSVTAANGRVRSYNINIKYEGTVDRPSIATIMNNSGVKYNDNEIYGIGPSTTASSLINNIKNVSSLAYVNVYDRDGNLKNDGILKTGDVIYVANGIDSKKYEVVIYGDVNGDGVIDKLDYLAVLRMFYGYTSYSGVYKKAADANRDGEVNKLDYLAILRQYYGYSTINQF